MNRMNLRMSLLVGATVPLILAGSAPGEVLGVKAVKKFVDPADIAADTNLGGLITSLMVVNVYATFTPGDAAAQVLGVGGSAALGILLQINTRDGTFFQHPLGAAGHTSPSAALASIPGFNTLKHDSFVTIGRKLDDDPIFGPDQTQVIGLDTWTDTQFTGSAEGDWFIAGFPAQGDAGQGPDNPPDQVLIGQYTVANPGPNAGVFGSMFVNGFHTNAAGFVELFTITGTFDNQVPAPGALALLGTAGLLGTRRRRKRLRTHPSGSGGTILSPRRERACAAAGSFSFSSRRRTMPRCMNRLNLKVSLLAGASVPLIIAGSASGEFLGLKTVKKFVDLADIAADTNIPGVTSLLVVNVYAEFTPGDSDNHVVGAGGSVALGFPLQVNTRDGTFFQHPFGRANQLSPSAALAGLPGFNTLKYDSFVTIGRKLDADPIFGPDETIIIGGQFLHWTETRLTNTGDVDWDSPGVNTQAFAGQGPDNPPDQVLIAQFTVANPGPNAGVFGIMFIAVVEVENGVVDFRPVSFDNQIPAPGTLALLAVAGLMGSRRRRK